MIRLWNRVGTVRAVAAVLVLIAGIAGGLVIADRQTQHKAVQPVNAADAVSLPSTTDGPSVAPTAAPSTSEQVDAQSKAQDAASAAAAQAKAADDAARKKKADEEAASRSTTRTPGPPGAAGPPGPPSYPIPASCDVYASNDNKHRGCGLLLASGFGLDQMPCLEKLWDRESHWSTKAQNKSSGAFGIPQALPGSKMAAFGADWASNPDVQIKWGLSYIKGKYKTPCGAWSHSQSTGWY